MSINETCLRVPHRGVVIWLCFYTTKSPPLYGGPWRTLMSPFTVIVGCPLDETCLFCSSQSGSKTRFHTYVCESAKAYEHRHISVHLWVYWVLRLWVLIALCCDEFCLFYIFYLHVSLFVWLFVYLFVMCFAFMLCMYACIFECMLKT